MARAPSKQAIAAAIQEDNAKRAKRGQDKRAATRAAKQAQVDTAKATADAKHAEHDSKRDKDAEQAAYLTALKVDAQAMIDSGAWTGSIEEYVAKELDLPADSAERKTRERTYFGPMLALRDAAKRYVKAPNGILNNGDRLATFLGSYTREQVVTGLVRALVDAKLEAGNRYAHMNPGQQSMNLRNRCRHQLAAGTITMVEIEKAFAGETKVS